MGLYSTNNDAVKEMRREEQEKNIRIAQGKDLIEQQFSSFSPEFYNKRAQDYQAYALPTLAQEYNTNKKALTYKLANQGLMQSGAASSSMADLVAALQQGQRTIANEGQNQANQLKATVEQGRQSAVSQLLASTDPYAAAQSAYGTASQALAPSAFAPVGNLLDNWKNITLAQTLSNIWSTPMAQYQQSQRDLAKTSTKVN